MRRSYLITMIVIVRITVDARVRVLRCWLQNVWLLVEARGAWRVVTSSRDHIDDMK